MRATTNRGGWFLLCAAAGLLALVSCGDNPAGPTGLLDLDQLADDNLVLDGPIAHIDASATIAIAPATIKFSAAGSVSPFGDIVAYDWDFGVGGIVAASETYHTFVDPGLHTVGLTVYDQIGESGSAAAQVAVLPEVEIACAPAGASGPAPLRLEASVVSIDGTSSLPGDVEFRWDFGDGAVGEGPNVVHVYERPGRYTLVLVLALGALTLQGDQLAVTVDGPFVADNQPPVADAGADQVVVDEDGDGAEFVLLDGSGSYDPDGKIVWYRWALTEGSQVLAVGQEPKCEVPLAVGQHDITLTVTDDQGAQGSDSLRVTVVARAALAALAVTPADDFASEGEVGGAFSPGHMSYTLTNVGQEELDWTATKTQSWVSLSSAGGTLAAGASTTVTVSINAAADALAAGSYSDTVTFTNTTTHSGDTTRGVSLTVNPPAGVLAVTPGTNLVSSGTVGGPFSPSSQVYTLQNTGGQTLNWTAAKTQSWVSLSSAGGTLTPGASTTVTVSINAAADALAAGSYSDTVTFTNTTTHSGDTTRSVSLTVNPPAGVLAVTPGTNLVSSGTVGGPFSPSSQVYTLQNTGGQTLNWTAAKTQSWVSLSSAGGTLAAGASTTVTVSINAAADALAAGSYSDTVTFTNTTTHSGDTTRGVSLTVNPPAGVLAVTPATNLVSSGTVGGPFSPSAKVYTLQNTGGQTINWTATKTQSWVSLSSAGGTLAAGASTTVTVSINAAADALAAGSYSDTVTFTNTTTHSGDTTRGVSLTVNPPAGVLAVTPGTNLVSSGTVGGPFSPSSQVYTLQNTGGQTLNWTAAKTQSWVSLSSAGGTLAAGASTTVTVSINAAADALAAGSYSDTVTFTNTTTHSSDTTRGVSLTVIAPALPLISGRVTENGGAGVGGVVLAGLPDDPTTDGAGYYQASVSDNWSGTVTPTKAGYTFEPASREYAGVTSDQPNQDYTATPPEEQWADHVSQYGITWTFDRPYRVGQFVNGDWWVCPDEPDGTVTVISVDPAPIGSGASARHGSMLNPMGRHSQSYDGRGTVYSDSYKVTYPAQLSAWDSLMSSISRPEDDASRSDVWGRPTSLGRVKLLDMAVLTCAPHGTPDLEYMFRPPYSYPYGGVTGDKQLYDSRDIQWDLLPTITPASGFPSMAAAARGFQRVCPMHVSGSSSENIRPVNNCGGYYSGQHIAESWAALLMLCDPAVVGDRTDLVINFLQFGIDTSYALHSYDPADPVRNDRCVSKWPMVFASLMLGASDLRTIPAGAYLKVNQPAYASCWTGADVVWVKDGVPPSHETLHYENWCEYSSGGSGFKADVYRRQTHSWTWVGTALAARLMGAEAAWGHPAFFDYMDRWMLFGEYVNDDDAYDTLNALAATNPCNDSPPLSGIGYRQGQVPGQTWVKNMWDQYRSP